MFAPHVKPILEINYASLAEEVAALGAGLLQVGIVGGEHIALFSDNRPQWLMADLAITGVGAVDVPRGSDTSTAEFQFIIEHSGCAGAFIQDKRLFDRLAAAGALNSLRFVVLMDNSEPKSTPDQTSVYRFDDLLAQGRARLQEFWDTASRVLPSALASIVYTSGTTGSPKGVMLTHANLMTQPLGVDLGIQIQPGEILLSILPAWHAYERAVEYFGIYHGATITYSDKKYIREDLIKVKPHLLPCVPRIWESVYKAIQMKLGMASERDRKIFQIFFSIGLNYVRSRRVATGFILSSTQPTQMEVIGASIKAAVLYPLYKLGDRLVFRKLRQVTGGRLRAAISGGGSLAPYLDDFFDVAGVPILNGYGSTETSPVITVRRVHHNVRGSVGLPMVNTEVRLHNESGQQIANDKQGEIWVRGPQVMRGYYSNPDATSKVLTEDGWFKTGDLGWFTATGDLVIAGRAKDTIVLSSGENVEPDLIEDVCRQSPLVQQIMLVGQDQKNIAALVVPDYGHLAEALGLPAESEPEAVVGHPQAARHLRQVLAEIMTRDGRFKASESISRVHLLAEPFSESNGLLTNTMKIKRNVVAREYKNEIAALFE